ncbi:MAG: hypothetical protein WA183_05720 [Chthoniobacterales bacterium]
MISSFAGDRHFTYLYEAPTSPPGSIDLESTITWARTTGTARLDEVDFREEVEIGITDRFQIGLYPLDWNYRNLDTASGFNYDGGALELIYNLTNPVVDPVGISLYEEIKGGDRLFELESKLIAQKNFGRLILDYNATLEAQWAGSGLGERNGELQQAFGASYEISPRVSVGLEILHEFLFPQWRDREKIRNFFIGPNVAIRHGRWFVTVTALAQATDTADEPDVQVRTILGFGF